VDKPKAFQVKTAEMKKWLARREKPEGVGGEEEIKGDAGRREAH
jgi:hypothetical protein